MKRGLLSLALVSGLWLLAWLPAASVVAEESVEIKPLTPQQLKHKQVRIAAVQLDSPWVWKHPIDPANDPADRIVPYIEKAAADGCDLVCFPELYLGMFRVPSKQTETVAKAARENKINVSVGCFEITDKAGNYRNSILMFDRTGEVVGRYFKAYQAVGKPPYLWPPLADDPEWMMQPGQEFPVFDLDFGRVGILTCYDGYFPEIWRLLSLKGAEIILWPNARGGSVEDYMVRSAIARNYVHVVTTNKTLGSGTMIGAWPNGVIQASTEPGEWFIANNLDLERLRKARINAREFHQRRGQLHRELAKDYPVWRYYGKEEPVGTKIPKPDDRLRREILDRIGEPYEQPSASETERAESSEADSECQPDAVENASKNGDKTCEPEIWLGHYNPERLGDPDSQWSRASDAVDGIEFYINMIAYKTPQQDYRTFCESLRKRGIDVAISAGYFDWESLPTTFETQSADGPILERVRQQIKPGIGALTAKVEMQKLKNLIEAADGIDLVALDGPIRRLLNPGADTGRATPHGEPQGLGSLEQAVDEIVQYMKVWEEKYPKVRFVVLTNFPNWGWNGEVAYWASGKDGMYWGDYRPAIELLIKRCREAGVALDGIRADHPYEFATGKFELTGTKWPAPVKDPKSIDWIARLLELEKLVRDSGYKFELIVNSEYGGATSNEGFAKHSLEYLDLYHRRGGRPDRYVLEGWYQYPKEVAPDTVPYTLSHTAIEYAKRIENRGQ